MANSFKSLTLLVAVLAGIAGCRGPTELFSCIDRHCFCADWMNDHSCVSCDYACNARSRPTVSKIREQIPAPAEPAGDGPELQ
jgi:hypothetical protein